MKKTLLVNCSLKGAVSGDLFGAITKFSEPKVLQYSDISVSYRIETDFDAVVISGSAARIVDPKDQVKFSGVSNLIRTCKLPLLGICFGHQLLCWTLGAKVGSLSKHFEGFEQVRIACQDEIFDGFSEKQTVPLAENHFDYVQKGSLDSAGFKFLANSASCEVEAVKHKSKPFWGVQFHPERITIKNQTHPEGHKILENFYRNVRRLGI